MFTFGIYKNRLYKVLISTGIIFILLLAAILGGYWHRQQKSGYLHNLSNTTAALEANSNIALNLISRAIHDVSRNKEIAKWNDSASPNELYFNSIAAMKQLQLITTDSSLVDYDFSVTAAVSGQDREMKAKMVLRTTGTMDRDYFLRKEKGLSSQEINDMERHFAISNRPFCLPHYKDSLLESVYYVVRGYKATSNLLCFVTIPVETLSGSQRMTPFLLLDGKRFLAKSSLDAQMNTLLHCVAQMPNTVDKKGGEYIKCQDKYVFFAALPAFGWKLAYVYDDYALNAGQVLFFLLFLVTAGCIFTFVMALLVEALYKPIKDVVMGSLEGASDDKPIDECKLIKQNSERIKALSKTLMETISENERLASQQQYRKLLFAPSPEQKETEADLTGIYSVALMEFTPMTEESAPSRIVILKQYVHEFTMENPGLTFVDLDSKRCAVILKCGDEKAGIRILHDLLHLLEQKPEDGSINQWFALSNPKTGLNHIWMAYQETLRILEYKHLYGHANILTFEQIRSLDAVTYSYPLSMENRLVHCIVEGKEEALQLFDQLIRTNLAGKTLSIESIQSFVYVLIGTLGRVFQELKTTPEALLKEELNFKYLYEHWNDSATITTLRQTLQDILTAVSCRENNNDQRLLGEMIRYIHHNYMDDIMLGDMADQFNISPKYCGILFKQLSEQNFKDYLNRFRIERAVELMEQRPHIKIASLSLLVGFNSANSFIRVFGKYMGVTPKAYMESLGEGGELQNF